MLSSGRLTRLVLGPVLLSAGTGASLLTTAVPAPFQVLNPHERAAARGVIPNKFPRCAFA